MIKIKNLYKKPGRRISAAEENRVAFKIGQFLLGLGYGNSHESTRIIKKDEVRKLSRKSRTCDECDGEGTVECPECDGTGEVECSECSNMKDCDECDGEGTVECLECDGTGKVDEDETD